MENNKRYRTPEKAKPSKKNKLDSYWLNSVDNANRFEMLSVHEDQPRVEENEKPVKPPPIFVDRVVNIQPLVKLLTDTVPGYFEIKVLSSYRVKIQTNSPDSFSLVIKSLESKNTEAKDVLRSYLKTCILHLVLKT